ncbi:unnamed protein product [Clonostachys rhizophaga]|uniref:Uncharacterized protein n=1 Tax=Clonostachys rhizophaga TaxID=160324 RepID=A0A9N9V1J0_9HYPO|nr:unnamed protein product [Clonostachys rhizophaga]
MRMIGLAGDSTMTSARLWMSQSSTAYRPPHNGLVRGPPYPLGFQRRIARWKSGERLKDRAISEEAACKE